MKQQGFVMLEVITAVVVVSSLLLMINQAWQIKSSQQKRQQWIIDAEQVRLAATNYWAFKGVPPTITGDIFTTQEISVLQLPWQQEWQFIHGENWLELSVMAPSPTQAQWLARQIAGAFTRNNEFVMPIWQPQQSNAINENYLHRQEQTDKPYLNTMETSLDMGLFDIINVNNLNTQRVIAESVRADAIEANSLKTGELTVTTLYARDVITPTTSLQEVSDRVAEYTQLWKECERQGKCS